MSDDVWLSDEFDDRHSSDLAATENDALPPGNCTVLSEVNTNFITPVYEVKRAIESAERTSSKFGLSVAECVAT